MQTVLQFIKRTGDVVLQSNGLNGYLIQAPDAVSDVVLLSLVCTLNYYDSAALVGCTW